MSSGTRRAIASILVVEDDVVTNDTIVELLESEGFRTRAAHDGATALEILRADRIALVVLDLVLPDMPGRELRRLQLQEPELAAIPVVAMTAGAPVPLDSVPIVRKPFDFDHLVRVIRGELDAAEERRHRTLLAEVAGVRRQLERTLSDLEAIRRPPFDPPPSSRRRR